MEKHFFKASYRKIIGFSLLIGAVAFAAVTLVVAIGSRNLAISGLHEKNPVENLPPSQIQGLTAKNNVEIIPGQTEHETTEEETNVTAAIAKNIAAELIAKNPQGPSLLEGKTGILAGDPQTLIDAAITNEIESFDYQALKPIISPNEIIINANPNTFTYQTYFLESQKIIHETYANLSFDPLHASEETFLKFEVAALATVSKLKALPVPAPLSALHREEISLITAESKVLRALAMSEEDPVRALAAIQALTAIDADFASLKVKFNKFILDNRIFL